MRPLIRIALLIALFGRTASGVVITGNDYYQLGEEYQRGYIHAFIDSMLLNKPADHWTSKCILSGITPRQIADILDARLKTHPEERPRPIQLTLSKTVSEACGELGYE